MENKNRLVVASEEWAQDLPEWMLDEIKTERIAEGIVSASSGKPQKVGDFELMAYLYTRSLIAPMGSDLTNAYLKLSKRAIARSKKVELPGNLGEGEYTEQEKFELERLRERIYTARGGEVRSPLFDALKKMRE